MSFPVSPSKQKELEERFQRLGLREDDLKESFVRSSGAGGQNVNKVSTCVVLVHVPSGVEVKCQKTRSQVLNRYYARKIICEKLEFKFFQEKSEKQNQIEKIRRQKRKRSRRAKEKLLQDKHHRSKIKSFRKAFKDNE